MGIQTSSFFPYCVLKGVHSWKTTQVSSRGSSISKTAGPRPKTEIMAGITTFMTMAYILAVNPDLHEHDGHGQGCCF